MGSRLFFTHKTTNYQGYIQGKKHSLYYYVHTELLLPIEFNLVTHSLTRLTVGVTDLQGFPETLQN